MLEKVTMNEFDAFYKLLQESFPVDEFRPYDAQKRIFQKRNFHVLGYKDNNELKGIMAYWDLDSFIYLEHFATAPDIRNQGIGAKMIDEFKEKMFLPIALEVEMPTTVLCKKRIAFYTRHDFKLYNDFYTMPPLSSGQEPLQLMLMSSTILSEKEYKAIVSKIKYEVYLEKTQIKHVTSYLYIFASMCFFVSGFLGKNTLSIILGFVFITLGFSTYRINEKK